MSLSAMQASAYLHHLHFLSPSPEQLARFYGVTMGMTVSELSDGTWLASGPARRILFSPGEAKKLKVGAFAVRDAASLHGLQQRAMEMGLDPKPAASAMFQAGAFSVLDPDANEVQFGLSLPSDRETLSAGTQYAGLRGPLQHLTLASRDVDAIEDFYANKLGFGVSDRVLNTQGKMMTCFMRGNHEHHNLACFFQDRQGVDHHSYEAGEWDTIRDWCDHLSRQGATVMWGPGRHGPGNNLFIFVEDPDGNWIEISAELEVVHDRPVKTWPHEERTLNLWGHGKLRA